jgi:geranylgeranyl transferase type-2 subunit beta
MNGEWRWRVSYLQHLMELLSSGLAAAPPDFRLRHAAYLVACQNSDGGFSGRAGDSDLYYTAFALRGLAILHALTPQISDRAAHFLGACLSRHASVVDFYSLLYACMLVQAGGGPDVLAASPAGWPERVADTLESFRCGDGGYGKVPGAASGSTYHTFLVGLCYQLLGLAWPRSEDVIRFVEGRRREDGGFAEVAPMRRGGTNPTAAAVGTLQLVHGLDTPPPRTDKIVAFLLGMPSAEGGLRANERIPVADLLSTFTAVWTLTQLKAADQIAKENVRRYVLSLEESNGGFRAGLWDERPDVEYTFYGLGTLALVSFGTNDPTSKQP